MAFTSKRPGKTQQFNYFMMNNNTENAFYLVDMPGMGYAKARTQSGLAGWPAGWLGGWLGVLSVSRVCVATTVRKYRKTRRRIANPLIKDALQSRFLFFKTGKGHTHTHARKWWFWKYLVEILLHK